MFRRAPLLFTLLMACGPVPPGFTGEPMSPEEEEKAPDIAGGRKNSGVPVKIGEVDRILELRVASNRAYVTHRDTYSDSTRFGYLSFNGAGVVDIDSSDRWLGNIEMDGEDVYYWHQDSIWRLEGGQAQIIYSSDQLGYFAIRGKTMFFTEGAEPSKCHMKKKALPDGAIEDLGVVDCQNGMFTVSDNAIYFETVFGYTRVDAHGETAVEPLGAVFDDQLFYHEDQLIKSYDAITGERRTLTAATGPAVSMIGTTKDELFYVEYLTFFFMTDCSYKREEITAVIKAVPLAGGEARTIHRREDAGCIQPDEVAHGRLVWAEPFKHGNTSTDIFMLELE